MSISDSHLDDITGLTQSDEAAKGQPPTEPVNEDAEMAGIVEGAEPIPPQTVPPASQGEPPAVVTPESREKAPAAGEPETPPAPPPAAPAEEPPAPQGQEPTQFEVTDAKGKKIRVVPYGAMHAEREEHKKTKTSLEAERTSKGRMEQTFQTVMRNMAQPQPAQPEAPAEPAVPDFTEDPKGYIDATVAQAARVAGQGAAAAAQGDPAQEAAAAQVQEMMENYKADSIAFIENDPTFIEAYNYLQTTERAALREMGYTPRDVERIVWDYEVGLVSNAYRNGRHPAEVIIALSGQRGWTPTAGAIPPGDGEAIAAQLGPNPLPQPTPAQTQAAAAMDTVQRGQAAAASLSGTGGGGEVPATSGEMGSLEYLASLPEGSPEWDKAWAAYERAAKGR